MDLRFRKNLLLSVLLLASIMLLLFLLKRLFAEIDSWFYQIQAQAFCKAFMGRRALEATNQNTIFINVPLFFHYWIDTKALLADDLLTHMHSTRCVAFLLSVYQVHYYDGMVRTFAFQNFMRLHIISLDLDSSYFVNLMAVWHILVGSLFSYCYYRSGSCNFSILSTVVYLFFSIKPPANKTKQITHLLSFLYAGFTNRIDCPQLFFLRLIAFEHQNQLRGIWTWPFRVKKWGIKAIFCRNPFRKRTNTFRLHKLNMVSWWNKIRCQW